MKFHIPNRQDVEELRAREAGLVLLCVSDSSRVLAMRRFVLETFGYRVLTADGTTAIEILSKQAVHAAILDYRTPGTNGEVIAIQFKITRPAIPILMVAQDPATVPESITKLVSGLVRADDPPTALLAEIVKIVAHPERARAA
ncbi:MAG: response regulator [Acidobacteriota bacterium]|nr:response regulator [Acidobacteriota bacterium]